MAEFFVMKLQRNQQNSYFFSDPEGCSLLDPAVEAVPSPGGGQEVVPVGHDPAVQQQQREQTNCFTG